MAACGSNFGCRELINSDFLPPWLALVPLQCPCAGSPCPREVYLLLGLALVGPAQGVPGTLRFPLCVKVGENVSQNIQH